MIDCDDTIQNLYQYLDRELTADEASAIEAHLARCPGCFELERFESGVIKLVKRDCGSERAPRRLHDRVRAIARR